MDPMHDEIDPLWWEDVLAAAPLHGPYELPELLSPHLDRAAADPAVVGLQKLVLHWRRSRRRC